jgi:tetratricopeptide (TPR) repeat protein
MKTLLLILLIPLSLASHQAFAQTTPRDSALAAKATAFDKQGLNQFMKEEYEAALKSALTTLRLYKKAGMENTTAGGQAYGNVALMYHKLNMPEKALPYIEKSITIYEKLDPNHVYLKSAKEWKQKILDAMGK